MSPRDPIHYARSWESEREFSFRYPWLGWRNRFADGIIEWDSKKIDFVDPITGETYDIKRVYPGNEPVLGIKLSLLLPGSPDWIVVYDGEGSPVGKMSREARIDSAQRQGHIPWGELIYAYPDEMEDL